MTASRRTKHAAQVEALDLYAITMPGVKYAAEDFGKLWRTSTLVTQRVITQLLAQKKIIRCGTRTDRHGKVHIAMYKAS